MNLRANYGLQRTAGGERPRGLARGRLRPPQLSPSR
jgi:hypothetical protein